MESIVINIVWIISGLGIILYPAILLANVISMRNGPDRESVGALEYWRKNLPLRTAQIITTLFPVIDYACQRMSRTAFETGTMLPGHSLDASAPADYDQHFLGFQTQQIRSGGINRRPVN
ncbi:MAG: hypothetical protein QM762_00670 [Chryseolinea sp.]